MIDGEFELIIWRKYGAKTHFSTAWLYIIFGRFSLTV
jgi:hypothetical protein